MWKAIFFTKIMIFFILVQKIPYICHRSIFRIQKIFIFDFRVFYQSFLQHWNSNCRLCMKTPEYNLVSKVWDFEHLVSIWLISNVMIAWDVDIWWSVCVQWMLMSNTWHVIMCCVVLMCSTWCLFNPRPVVSPWCHQASSISARHLLQLGSTIVTEIGCDARHHEQPFTGIIYNYWSIYSLSLSYIVQLKIFQMISTSR